jgi:hypothetical protein
VKEVKNTLFAMRLSVREREALDALTTALGHRKRGKAVRFLIHEAIRHIPAVKGDCNALPE